MKNVEEYVRFLEEENTRLKSKISSLEQQLMTKKDTWSQTIIDSIPNPIFVKNENFQFVSANSAFVAIMKTTKKDLLGKTDFDLFSKEQASVFRDEDSIILSEGEIKLNEEEVVLDGQKRCFLTSKVKIEDYQGKPYILGLITDISDKRNSESILIKKNRELEGEKENVQVLLKEVYHRVKNNMQIISSILSLQMNDFDDQLVRDTFLSCKNRILAMSNVHELLYQTKNFRSISFSDYITKLIYNLMVSFELDDSIQIHKELEDVFITIDIAIPLGLIINEIITNSIKHAYHNNRVLNIYIKISSPQNNYMLEIGDDGSGFKKKEKSTYKGIGTELIELFCRQIEASLSPINKKNGTHYRIELPLKQ